MCHYRSLLLHPQESVLIDVTILCVTSPKLPLPFPVSHSLPSQNPDIVLVHYLNVPAIEDCGKPCGPILCSINTDKKEWAKWTKEELIGQLKPMCEYLSDAIYPFLSPQSPLL